MMQPVVVPAGAQLGAVFELFLFLQEGIPLLVHEIFGAVDEPQGRSSARRIPARRELETPNWTTEHQ